MYVSNYFYLSSMICNIVFKYVLFYIFIICNVLCIMYVILIIKNIILTSIDLDVMCYCVIYVHCMFYPLSATFEYASSPQGRHSGTPLTPRASRSCTATLATCVASRRSLRRS